MSRGRTTKDNRRERRMDRKNFGDYNRNLTVPDDVIKWAESNNKVLRFCNDNKANLQKRLRQDWDFVRYQGGEIGEGDNPQELGSYYAVTVGSSENGEPMKSYLMCKEKDWYDEDQKLKQKEIDQVDDEIRQGGIGKVENRYQPKDGSGRTITRYNT